MIIASDLDRTLIYSASARRLGADSSAVACVERRDGHEVSFMTEDAVRLLRRVAAEATFVPVTTRTVAQYRRVRLVPSSYAVATNGAVLLVDGVADDDWTRRIRRELAGVAPLAQVWTHLGQACLPEFTVKLRNAEDIFCYAVVHPKALPAGVVAELDEWARRHGWRASLQGRKLYCVPSVVTKSAAVREIARRTGTPTVLAAGDSLLDIDLLLAADRGIRPSHGELFEQGWAAPHVVGTAASGIAAGEEIVRWFASGVSENLAVQ